MKTLLIALATVCLLFLGAFLINDTITERAAAATNFPGTIGAHCEVE